MEISRRVGGGTCYKKWPVAPFRIGKSLFINGGGARKSRWRTSGLSNLIGPVKAVRV
jgi:hypothetical protein